MPEFKKSIEVHAPKRQIIDYVSKVENMPDYLPTVREAEMEGSDRVHMAVEINGEQHEDSGYFRVNGERLEWGSEDHDYHGAMVFNEQGDSTNVEIQLHINPPPELDARMDQNSGGDWTSRIEQGLDGALRAIKSQVEATTANR